MAFKGLANPAVKQTASSKLEVPYASLRPPLTSTLEHMLFTAQPDVASFVSAARGFCAWCEDPAFISTDYTSATFWFAQLHSHALRLPEVGVPNSDETAAIDMGVFERAQSNISTFAGGFYRNVFDPNPISDDPWSMGDLNDDLIDIYRDVREGLAFFEQGKTESAVWHWRFTHRSHWGRHAAGALHALHCFHVAA